MVFLARDTLLDRHVAIKFIPTLDDASLARFLVEARAAARVQHPNVATLYRVGQLEGRPYLVSELVRGTGLDRTAKPMAPEQVLGIALDLGRGLAAAHRRGVLHRDIKPGNAVRSDSGAAVLVDFGLAKMVAPSVADDDAARAPQAAVAGPPLDPSTRLSADEEAALRDLTNGQLVGTPYFMSPEAWARQPATERSDLYSLGLVLYELLAGQGPFRSVPLAELPHAVTSRDPPPLRSAMPTAPEGLAAAIDRCVRRDPSQRFAHADDLVARLEALRPARARGRVPSGNPYRGLRPFEPEHRALFFGRQRALTQALDRLRAESLLVVTGDSGVGKSSVCAAGLLPLASDGALEDGRTWVAARLVPGRNPAAALAAALAPLVSLSHDDALALIERDPGSLGRAARSALTAAGGDATGVLVYVDQLEELVTLAAPDQAAQVALALGSLCDGLPGVRVLATARTDFLSRLEALPGLRDRVSRGLFLLAPLARDEIREAIVGPAQVVGGRYETDELVDLLVDSTAAAGGGLPLLQFALAQLWQRRDPETGVILERSLAELGGVEGALSRHADGLLATLDPVQRAAARALLLRLVTVERTRARRLEDELVALSPAARPVLDALVRGRLLVASETPDGTTYEIAHETLVQGWSTLAGWLAEDAETRAMIDRVETSAAEWRRHGRTRELLWRGRQLGEVTDALDQTLTPREREFLDASHRADRRRRWTRRAAILAVLLAGTGIWLGAQVANRRQVTRQIAQAVTQADHATTAATALDRTLARINQRALAAFDAGDAAAGETAWRKVESLRRELVDHYRSAADALERALLLDADRDDVRARYGRLLYTWALLAESSHQPDQRDELLRRMRHFDDHGQLARRWAAPGHVDVTSTPAGALVTLFRYRRQPDGHLVPVKVRDLGTSPLTGVALAPGSLLLVVKLPGRPPVRDPLLVQRGEHLTVSVPIPAASDIPQGFVWIPPGRALSGSSEADSLRGFFNAAPEHVRTTAGYFIARHETTFAEWLSYLDALPPPERARRTQKASQGGAVALSRGPDGTWRVMLHLGLTPLGARAGQPIHYAGRTVGADQDWLRMPVVGVSFDDARAYAAWLDRTGRVPGARVCNDVEWERAARGADGRRFPAGDTLLPDDANLDLTYGKNQAAFGPDEVGSHPAGRSPFGLDDMAGNVWEWVVDETGHTLARGGAFDYRPVTARTANREKLGAEYSDVSLGMRLCASPTKGIH